MRVHAEEWFARYARGAVTGSDDQTRRALEITTSSTPAQLRAIAQREAFKAIQEGKIIDFLGEHLQRLADDA